MNKMLEIEELKIENRKLQSLYLDALNKIDKAIEYNKEVLTWTTNEPITDEIAYKNLEILGGLNNEQNNLKWQFSK